MVGGEWISICGYVIRYKNQVENKVGWINYMRTSDKLRQPSFSAF